MPEAPTTTASTRGPEHAESNPRLTPLTRRALIGGAAASLAAWPTLRPASADAHPAQGHGPHTHTEGPARPAVRGAGYYDQKIGNLTATVISDGTFPFPKGLHPVIGAEAGAEAVHASLESRFVPRDAVTGHVNTLLVRTADGRNVLIDAGCGTAFGGATTNQLEAHLANAGLAPADVDAVVVTHAHPDHIGGLINDNGDLRFPDAEIVMAEAEHAFWRDPAFPNSALDDATITVFTNLVQNTLKKIGKDNLTLINDGDEAVAGSGVTAMLAPGHTPGHLLLHLESGGERLLYLSDVLHFPAVQFLHPDWKVVFDVDSVEAVKTRRKTLDFVAAERLAIAASHIPFPSFGHLAKQGSGYEFVPTLWTFS